MIPLLLSSLAALAASIEHQLTWDVTVAGTKMGQQSMTLKYVPSGDDGMLRIMESWTELDGALGNVRVQYKQRLTAHAGGDPASFHAVSEQSGIPQEVQGRYTAGTWWVTVAESGRTRSFDLPANRIDLSTADLFDPESRVALGRFDKARLLLAETGEIMDGEVVDLGQSTTKIGGSNVDVSKFAWDGPQGRFEFAYTADGYLVSYKMKLQGVDIEGKLAKRPPDGIDEFPVAVGTPAIDILDI